MAAKHILIAFLLLLFPAQPSSVAVGATPKATPNGVLANAYASRSGMSATPFTFDSLMEIIKINNITSVDQLIPWLPKSYRENFALMFQSGSLQAATPASPRVITYGSHDLLESVYPGENNDRLYIAFQTETDSTTSPNSLEVIEWVPTALKYQFYQLDFPVSANSVKVNPVRCSACHGDPQAMRPNWTAYPRWDGAAGNDNNMTGLYGQSTRASVAQAKAKFQLLQDIHPRLSSLDFSQFFTLDLENPAAYLSAKIGAQLAVRDVKFIQDTPDYDKFKYAFAGGFLECTNFNDFFNAETLQALRAGIFSNIVNLPLSGSAKTPLPSDFSFADLWRVTSSLVERNSDFYDHRDVVSVTTWLRFLFEGRGLAEPLRNLLGTPPPTRGTPGFSGWSYDMVDFQGGLSTLAGNFFKNTSADFPDMSDIFGIYIQEEQWRLGHHTDQVMTENGPATDLCKQLADKSRDASRDALMAQ